MSNSADLLHPQVELPSDVFDHEALQSYMRLHSGHKKEWDNKDHKYHFPNSYPHSEPDSNGCEIVNDLVNNEEVYVHDDYSTTVIFEGGTFRSIRATILFLNRFMREGKTMDWKNRIRDVDNEEDFSDIVIHFARKLEEVGF